MFFLRRSGLLSVCTNPSTASSRSGHFKYSANFFDNGSLSGAHEAISPTIEARPLKRQITSSKSFPVKRQNVGFGSGHDSISSILPSANILSRIRPPRSMSISASALYSAGLLSAAAGAVG